MAAMVSGVQASASLVVNACRSCHSLQQKDSMNVMCSSPQFCRSGALLRRSVTKVASRETRNHPQVSYFLKPKQTLRLRAIASTEFQSASSEAENATEVFREPDTITSSDVLNPPVEVPGSESGLPTEFDDAPHLVKEGTQAADSSSAIVTGDVPAVSPPVNDLPTLTDGVDSAPSTSAPGVDALQSANEDGSAGEAMLSAKERYLRLTEGRGDGQNDLPTLPDGVDSAPSTSAPGVDTLQSANEDGSAGEAMLSAKERYLRLTEGRGDSQPVEQIQTNDVGGAIKAAQDNVGGAIKSAQDSINSARDAAVNSVQGLVDGVVNAVRDTVDSAGSKVKNTYDSFNESVVRATKSVTGAYDKSVDNVQSNDVDTAQGVAVDFTSVFRVGTPANDNLKGIVTVVKSTTGSALAAAGNLISQGYTITKGNVPQDVHSFLDTLEEKVSQISGPVGSAFDQALVIITNAERAVGLDPENPVIPVILVLGGSLVLGFASFNSRYGGYSGDLLPSAALEILKDEKTAVLVDIRSQEAREEEGIPDLRRSFRAKFSIVEAVKVEGAIRGMLKNVSGVEVLLTAAVIQNLKNVKDDSKIIVLDSDGGQAKEIARGLRKSGSKRAYLVDGGFKAWASSGLRWKAAGTQSPLLRLQEDAQAIVEEVKPTTFGVSAALLGFVAGTYAVIEWEKTLQFIGLLGLAATVYTRLQSYDTVDDAKADLRLLQKPFNAIGQAVIWIAGFVEPKKLQLATSPTSSNVQGRVIQAAAKHGPTTSDLELVQDEPNALPAVEEDDRGNRVDAGDGDVDSGDVESGDGDSGGGVSGDGGKNSTQSQHTSSQEPQ